LLPFIPEAFKLSSEHVKIKVYKTIILRVVLMGVILGLAY
jgi:hypothetical protein